MRRLDRKQWKISLVKWERVCEVERKKDGEKHREGQRERK